MTFKWNIGNPGGMNGPFYSVVKSNGNVVAMQVTDKRYADIISVLGNASDGDFDTIHEAGKKLKTILKRDHARVDSGLEDYLIRAVMEALLP